MINYSSTVKFQLHPVVGGKKRARSYFSYEIIFRDHTFNYVIYRRFVLYDRKYRTVKQQIFEIYFEIIVA